MEVLYQYKVQDTFRALSVIVRSKQRLNRENNAQEKDNACKDEVLKLGKYF